METKSLIRTLKMQRGRYAKKNNPVAEKNTITSIIEKNGGKLEVIATLKEAGETELMEYVKSVIGVVKVKQSDEVEEIAQSTSGNLYRIDSIHKTCKKVLKDFSDLNVEDLEIPQMSLQVYQRYIKDNFDGETCTLKKGKLNFRGYRISCDVENGFMIEDTLNKYEVVETPWEGIPTPKELGEFFKKPRVEHTPEELKAAVELGKKLQQKSEEKTEVAEVEEIDFEKLRRKVLKTIEEIRSKTSDFDPTKFPDMIPFKRWKRKANALVKQWKNREIRYAKFLNSLEQITTEETFVLEEKNHRSKFTGTLLPEHTSVGALIGDKLEVDGKLVPAVPFLLEYLLHNEPRAMSQIMKYANGEITEKQLLENPLEVDWKVEYNKNALKNSAKNAQLLGMLYEVTGFITPQDLLFEADLKVGDKILLVMDGEIKKKTIRSVEKGIEVSGGFGLTKLDKWVKIEDAE